MHSEALREVLVFGGTTEGRELIEWLDARGRCRIVACTATAYGASLIAQGARVETVLGPLSREEKLSLVASHDFCCIVDATHPFARHITQSIDELVDTTGLELVRISRAEGLVELPPSARVVADAEGAARELARAEGNVLLTTGTNELERYVQAVADFPERLYVRVLPVPESIARLHELGIPASHIVAMQGPFSAELNAALLRELSIHVMLTKESGAAGGFAEKVEAAVRCGVRLIVVARPEIAGGTSLDAAKHVLATRFGL